MAAQISPFQLFGLNPGFAIDDKRLDAAYQAAMLKVHPDRFADRSAAERRVAEQWSARINEAHDTLKNPVARASWLCETAGYPIGAETNTSMPMDFLMKQMEWREALEAASTAEEIAEIHASTQKERDTLLEALGRAIDEEKNFTVAVDLTRRLMFVNRFMIEVERKENN